MYISMRVLTIVPFLEGLPKQCTKQSLYKIWKDSKSFPLCSSHEESTVLDFLLVWIRFNKRYPIGSDTQMLLILLFGTKLVSIVFFEAFLSGVPKYRSTFNYPIRKVKDYTFVLMELSCNYQHLEGLMGLFSSTSI